MNPSQNGREEAAVSRAKSAQKTPACVFTRGPDLGSTTFLGDGCEGVCEGGPRDDFHCSTKRRDGFFLGSSQKRRNR